MNYSVGLYSVPEEFGLLEDTLRDAYSIIYGSEDIQDLIQSIVYGKEYDNLLASDNFIGDSGSYFEDIFDISLTNETYYKFVTESYFEEVEARLRTYKLDEYEARRVKEFMDTITECLAEAKYVFFWCD